jgi:tRNA(Ile)-lysidine synthase
VLTAGPLTDDDFAGLMALLGPFEHNPAVAVAVSGGADSLALCLLADRWARGKGGKVLGLTVDHGLRPASAAEAEQVGIWLGGRAIAHRILCWRPDRAPSGDIQAAARRARYALLAEECRSRAILHLLLGHHRDDQAETVLLRLARGSGVDGLAAMAGIAVLADQQILRPFLAVPRARLEATLRSLGQSWIDDPSNVSDAYGRSRLRRLMPILAAEGVTAAGLAATSRRLGRARQALEKATEVAAVGAVTLDPAGFAWLDAAALAVVARDISLRLVGRLCRTIGGSHYPPRIERLERLEQALRHGLRRRRTFAGCLFVPTADRVMVCREPAAIGPSSPLVPGHTVLWDGRFSLRLAAGEGFVVTSLGQDGWRTLRDRGVTSSIPRLVATTLPAIVDKHGISAVPHLGYDRSGGDSGVAYVAFTPAIPLAGVGYCLV